MNEPRPYRAVCLDCTTTKAGNFRDEHDRDSWASGHHDQNHHRVTLLPTEDDDEHPRYQPTP